MVKTAPIRERAQSRADGEAGTLSIIFPLVYDQMRAIARRKLRREGPGHELSAGDLVHEAYMRLAAQTAVRWTGPGHVLALAETTMRRILIDHARSARCAKRGGGRRGRPLHPPAPPAPSGPERAELLLVLEEAMDRLHRLSPRSAHVVQYRFLDGMTEAEAAAALGISVRTAKRDWAEARAWLYTQILRNPQRPLTGSRPRVGHWERDSG